MAASVMVVASGHPDDELKTCPKARICAAAQKIEPGSMMITTRASMARD